MLLVGVVMLLLGAVSLDAFEYTGKDASDVFGPIVLLLTAPILIIVGLYKLIISRKS